MAYQSWKSVRVESQCFVCASRESYVFSVGCEADGRVKKQRGGLAMSRGTAAMTNNGMFHKRVRCCTLPHWPNGISRINLVGSQPRRTIPASGRWSDGGPIRVQQFAQSVWTSMRIKAKIQKIPDQKTYKPAFASVTVRRTKVFRERWPRVMWRKVQNGICHSRNASFGALRQRALRTS